VKSEKSRKGVTWFFVTISLRVIERNVQSDGKYNYKLVFKCGVALSGDS